MRKLLARLRRETQSASGGSRPWAQIICLTELSFDLERVEWIISLICVGMQCIGKPNQNNTPNIMLSALYWVLALVDNVKLHCVLSGGIQT